MPESKYGILPVTDRKTMKNRVYVCCSRKTLFQKPAIAMEKLNN